MLFTTQAMLQLFPNTHGATADEISIKHVATDTRVSMNHALFVPIKGENFNGHNYLRQAIEQGAVAALWNKNENIPAYVPTDFPIFLVDNTLTALQQLAAYYRELVDPHVIGVTGSNGKTTTKDIIASVLAGKFKTHRTQGNLNNHIGVPLTILSMPNDTEVLVVEMGMNHFGEIEVLSKIAQPNHAVITNIGESHIEFLGSRAGIAKAKSEILTGLDQDGKLIFDGDEPLLYPYQNTVGNISIGFNETNAIVIKDVVISSSSSTFYYNQEQYSISLLGKHHVKNASFAIAIAKELGVKPQMIREKLETIELTGMRFETAKGRNGATIIDDTYNASPTSMRAAIEVVKELKAYDKKILVLGDMFELGENTKAYHREIAEEITKDIHYLCTIGESALDIHKAAEQRLPALKSNHFATKDDLIHYLQPLLTPSTVVLLKASRGMKLEEVSKQLV